MDHVYSLQMKANILFISQSWCKNSFFISSSSKVTFFPLKKLINLFDSFLRLLLQSKVTMVMWCLYGSMAFSMEDTIMPSKCTFTKKSGLEILLGLGDLLNSVCLFLMPLVFLLQVSTYIGIYFFHIKELFTSTIFRYGKIGTYVHCTQNNILAKTNEK